MNHLPAAAARREVLRQMAALVETLPVHDQRVVLEDLLEKIYSSDLLAAMPPIRRPDEAGSARLIRPPDLPPPPQLPAEGLTLPERILIWCKRTETRDGIYSVSNAARALIPTDKHGSSKVYTAIIRSSPQSDRAVSRPRFIWLKQGKFKLHSTDESV